MAGIDSYVKLMLHGNGTNGSTTIVDSSSSSKTVTAVGNTQISTAQSKFGGASILFDGSGDRATVPDSPDWDLGSGDFTVDCWVYLTNASANNVVFGRVTGPSSYMYWQVTSGVFRFVDYNSGYIKDFNVNMGFTANTWHHIALVRSGNTLRMFKNGVQSGTSTFTGSFLDRSDILDIGAMTQNASYVMNGYIDEFRFSKGIARWTANFTPETTEYTSDTFLTLTINESLSLTENTLTNISLSIGESVTFTDTDVVAENISTIITETISILDNVIPEVGIQINEYISCNDSTNYSISLNQNENLTLVESKSLVVPINFNKSVKIISYNPLILVSDTSPAQIMKVDITNPSVPVFEAYDIVGCNYATDVSVNTLDGLIYVTGKNSTFVQIDINDLSNQTLINLSDTDEFLFISYLLNSFYIFIGTDNVNGKTIFLDNRDTKILSTSLQTILNYNILLSTTLWTIEAKSLSLQCDILENKKKILSTNLYIFPQQPYISSPSIYTQTPLSIDNLKVYLDEVELPSYDLIAKSVSITHQVDADSVASLSVARRHDNINKDINGNTRTITNQNTIRVTLNNQTIFTGNIIEITCVYSNSTERVDIRCSGTQETREEKTIELQMPGLNEQRHLYHIISNQVKIQDPIITEDTSTEIVIKVNNSQYYKYAGQITFVNNINEASVFDTRTAANNIIPWLLQNYPTYSFKVIGGEAAKKYNGVEVEAGIVKRQIFNADTFSKKRTYFTMAFDEYDSASLAQDVAEGKFKPLPGWTYFWWASIVNISPTASFTEELGWVTYQEQGQDITKRVNDVYIGTSPASLSSSTWNLLELRYKRQKEYNPEYQDINTYMPYGNFVINGYDVESKSAGIRIGFAPYKKLSVRNDAYFPATHYEEVDEVLYFTREDGYDYRPYAYKIAQQEYRALLASTGEEKSRITSCDLSITLDAYLFYNLKLMNHININNTTDNSIYKNNNGFPLSIKTININFSSMTVSLSANNELSQEQLTLIETNKPDENDSEYIIKGFRIAEDVKFDVAHFAKLAELEETTTSSQENVGNDSKWQ